MIADSMADDLLAILLAPAPVAAPVDPKPTVRKSRHFYRCNDCLGVAVTDERIPYGVMHGIGPKSYPDPLCATCGGKVEYMGETKYTVGGHEYALKHVIGYAPACDGKCISAVGPGCDCQCGGENHGTGRCVEVYEQSGVPAIKTPDNGKVKADEYRALVAETKSAWSEKYGYVTKRKHAGEYVENFDLYLDGQHWWKQIGKARTMRTHGGRNKRLQSLIQEFRNTARSTR